MKVLETLSPGSMPFATHVPAINEDSSPAALVAWALERFARQRVIITTQFGMEGCALIDMCARHGRPLTVAYLDTMFLFPETYALRDRLMERYANVSFVNRGTDLTPAEQDARHAPQLWRTNPNLCCQLRKADPMRTVMQDVDVWLTALRRSQSPTRANLRVVEWDWKFLVLKVNPLARWERKDVWDYIQTHDVPYNPLHERGFPTIGCTHCTQPVAGATITDYSRAGRWSGTEKTECGLHGDAI